MNKTTKVVLGIVAVLVVGFLGWKALQPQTGGDFAGGITPSQLFTANSSANSITPVLSNLYLTGGVSVGGTAAANQIPVIYTATTQFPATTTLTLGPIQATTSTTSTAVSFSASGFAIGDACEVFYNGNGTSTTAFGADGFITAYSTSTGAATATVTFWNGNSAAITFTVTSTVTGVSSTIKTTCFHTGV
jgi:hypothetical protein